MQLSLSEMEPDFPQDGPLPDRSRRVYCNRSLRFDQLEWVGFDMDYTLAIYDQQQMDQLSVGATIRKLVERGYPESLLDLEFELEFPVRGLIVDRELGNVIKMDRYKYVKRAYHGTRELSLEERRHHYHAKTIDTGSERYHWVDTLYALCEVTVYAAAIDHLEQRDTPVDHAALFADVRTCIDVAHQDGSILEAILQDPARYLHRDAELAPTLHKLRSAGKKLFLLTNSRAPYTEQMMAWLLDGALPGYASYRQYFDLIVTAARKPLFFSSHAKLTRLPEEVPVEPGSSIDRQAIYAGGSLSALQQLMNASPDTVLYVGDHIYGDVLRAKTHGSWRTVMVIQEMEQEMRTLEQCAPDLKRWDELDRARRKLVDDLRQGQAALRDLDRKAGQSQGLEEGGEPGTPRRQQLRRRLDETRARLKQVERECSDVEAQVEQRFHIYWGPLFKAGTETSSFGHQVETYACLYTSKVSNLINYSPLHYFQSPRDRMPHEL